MKLINSKWCSMKVNVSNFYSREKKLNWLIVCDIAILLIIGMLLNFFKPKVAPRTLACLTRIDMPTGKKPFFWKLFGQNDDEELPQPADNANDKDMEELASRGTSEWIQKLNYPLEQHNVTTADGYHLQLHRLPRNGHRPILLLHGLMASSLSWVLMGANKSLAFQLYDGNYDVWLGNFRGSIYAREHRSWNLTNDEFWNYSFHENGLYDMPTIIDYIREQSSFHQILVIGHSQAFNSILVLCSLRPEYNDRIQLLQALAPIADLRNQVKFTNEDVRKLTKFIKKMISQKKFPVLSEGFLKRKCLTTNDEGKRTCISLIKTFLGASSSKPLDSIIYDKLLYGGSAREITHLTQIWKSGDFVAFDYDVEGNLMHYNSVEPMSYNLSKISIPMILYFGETDALATPNGVHHTYSNLLEKSKIVIGVYRINSPKFNHLDFITSKQATTLVNHKIIEHLDKFQKGTLTYVIE